jgi:tripartite-type tricarboxylate transporter receptor subunit TctC
MLEGLQPMTKVLAAQRNSGERSVRRPTCPRTLATVAAGLALLAAVLLSTKGTSLAQEWPAKPVKLINPFSGGGSVDRMARIAAEELSRSFKQQFYVENRVGGGGTLGAAQVARADPDGYTLLMGNHGSNVFAPATLSAVGYDAVGDFTHIAMVAGESYVFVAHASVGVRSFADFLAWAKRQPQPINIGSSGLGTLGQLVVEQLMRKPGLLPKINHVPYRGGGPLVTDLLGNHVSFGALALSNILEHVRAGTLVPLALISDQRNPAITNLPAFAELGHPDIGGATWAWIAGPRNLPVPIVDRLNQEVRRWIKRPEVKQQFERDAYLTMDVNVPTLTAFVMGELKRWSTFADEAGLKAK